MSVTNGMEKHIQTGIQVVLVAITMWVGSSILSLRDATIRNEEKISHVQSTMVDLRAEVAVVKQIATQNQDRDYNQAQALRALEERFARMEQRRRRGETEQ